MALPSRKVMESEVFQNLMKTNLMSRTHVHGRLNAYYKLLIKSYGWWDFGGQAVIERNNASNNLNCLCVGEGYFINRRAETCRTTMLEF